MSIQPSHNRMRRFQFRLRTWLLLMLAAALAASIYGWRQRREDRLLHLINEFHTAVDQQQYEEAEQISLQALTEFPCDEIAIALREKGRLITSLVKGEPLQDGFVCGTGLNLGMTHQSEAVANAASSDSQH